MSNYITRQTAAEIGKLFGCTIIIEKNRHCFPLKSYDIFIAYGDKRAPIGTTRSQNTLMQWSRKKWIAAFQRVNGKRAPEMAGSKQEEQV